MVQFLSVSQISSGAGIPLVVLGPQLCVVEVVLVLLSVDHPSRIRFVEECKVIHSSVVIFLDPSLPEVVVFFSPINPHSLSFLPEVVKD